MLGVIFCGGQSSRMTSDKGLLKIKDQTWAEIAADKLKSLKLPVVISVNRSQVAAYSSIFATDELVIDYEELHINGPLCGTLSTHLQYPEEDLLILACDMPLMESGLPAELIQQYHRYGLADCFIYTNDGEPEPLCGIYRSKGLAHIMNLFRSGQLLKYSMKYMLDQLAPVTLAIPENKKDCFRNFNTQAELNGL